MVDEPKNPDREKPGQPEAPKGIEDVLKELPKINVSPPPPSKPLMSIPPKPATPPQSQPPPNPDKFQSFVRTMESDLEAAKKGLKPESKPFEIKPPPQAPPGPPITQPPEPKPPTHPLKLGPAEKAKPLDLPKPPTPMGPKMPGPILPPPPTGNLPKPKKGFSLNPRLLIVALLAVVIVFAGIWFFMTREQEAPVVFTPTPTPVPTPLTLSELILSKNQITISSTENFQTELKNEIKNIPVPAGSFAALEIMDENGNEYSLPQILAKLMIEPPSSLLENLDSNEWTLILFGQTEIFNESGFPLIEALLAQEKRIGLIGKTNNPTGLRSILNAWEITMTDDLKDLFGINIKKVTSEAFLDNIYSGQTIRYRNFPYADKSIDYSLVSLTRFNADYFILTNSRESIYSAIDLLQNQ